MSLTRNQTTLANITCMPQENKHMHVFHVILHWYPTLTVLQRWKERRKELRVTSGLPKSQPAVQILKSSFHKKKLNRMEQEICTLLRILTLHHACNWKTLVGSLSGPEIYRKMIFHLSDFFYVCILLKGCTQWKKKWVCILY